MLWIVDVATHRVGLQPIVRAGVQQGRQVVCVLVVAVQPVVEVGGVKYEVGYDVALASDATYLPRSSITSVSTCKVP